MSKNWQDITLSLAGIFQACALVHKVATSGQLPQDYFQASIESVVDQDPSSTLNVFGDDVNNLRLGLETMREILKSNNKQHPEILRYGLSVILLQKKLMSRDDMLGVIGSRLTQVKSQVEHFSSTHDNVIGNIADIYTETLSKFTYRIQVTGDYNQLQQTRVANQIRALLFCAVRAAILWRQNGGSRLQFVLNRKQIAFQIDELLAQTNP